MAYNNQTTVLFTNEIYDAISTTNVYVLMETQENMPESKV
jgi:hypothetical protein